MEACCHEVQDSHSLPNKLVVINHHLDLQCQSVNFTAKYACIFLASWVPYGGTPSPHMYTQSFPPDDTTFHVVKITPGVYTLAGKIHTYLGSFLLPTPKMARGLILRNVTIQHVIEWRWGKDSNYPVLGCITKPSHVKAVLIQLRGIKLVGTDACDKCMNSCGQFVGCVIHNSKLKLSFTCTNCIWQNQGNHCCPCELNSIQSMFYIDFL